MAKVRIGSAPDSWGVWFADDTRQTPWRRCLDEMAAAGYDRLELGPWGYLPNDPDTLAAELDQRGLELAATTVIGDVVSDEATAGLHRRLARFAAFQKRFGARYVVLIPDMYIDPFSGEQTRAKDLSEAEWSRLLANTQALADAAARDGLKLVMHPHAETHVETEAQIERFLAESPVDLCLDTGHHAYAGGDPAAFMQKHHRRIPYLHLKSCDAAVRAAKDKHGWSFAEAVKRDVMCEPALGMVDFPAFKLVLDDIGYDGVAIVEQDMFPCPFDKPFPIAKRTRAYLREIGLG